MHIEHSRPGDALPSSDAIIPYAGLATVAFLGITAGVQMSDRGLQAILSPAIKASFGVGDAVMGALAGIAGILVASALAVPLAKLADRHSRKHILLGLIAAWGALTAIGALAPNFPLFFIGRAASGVTEFAMIPIVYSLIPDLAGERWRVSANLAFAALMAMGASAGFYLGGAVIAFVATSGFAAAIGQDEAWRAVLLLLSLGSIPLLLLGLLTLDPPRRTSGAADKASPSLVTFLVSRRREIALFLGAAGGLAIAVQATTPMIAMAIVRRFPADLGEIGHALGIITLVTSLGSLPLAGLLDRTLRGRTGERTRPLIMAGASLLALPCAAAFGMAGSEGSVLILVSLFILLTCIANALIPTMLQDIAPSELCARCFATYSFAIAAFCAIGPLLSGSISQYVLANDLLGGISLAAVPALLLTIGCAAISGTRTERSASVTV